MPNPFFSSRRPAGAPPAIPRPQYGPGNMPPLPPRPAPPLSAPALPQAPSPSHAAFVMPLTMPPLPPTPPPKPQWTAVHNPSAGIVQQQYVDLRLEELAADRKPGRKRALAVLEKLLLKEPQYAKYNKSFFFKGIPRKELLRIYEAIERNLQTADLTINFFASSWFKEENPYDTYTQMYERAMVGGQMVLKATDKLRVGIDNQVTFPEHWKGADTPARRGLSPGPQGPDRLMAQMDTGALNRSADGQSYTAENRNFNPHSKQIFIGLNYGRRAHGSCGTYGDSYLVLKNKLKMRCFYYAGDTFEQQGRSSHAGTVQAPYDNLGALLGMAEATTRQITFGGPNISIVEAILESCYKGKVLPDTCEPKDLLEAHHFGELNFREHVKSIAISPRLIGDTPWPTIVENARKFAERTGVKLFQVD